LLVAALVTGSLRADAPIVRYEHVGGYPADLSAITFGHGWRWSTPPTSPVPPGRGYREAGRLPRYYGGREDAVRMTRDLRHPESRRMVLPAPSSPASGTLAGADWILTKFKR
jgi:hypothetical protein